MKKLLLIAALAVTTLAAKAQQFTVNNNTNCTLNIGVWAHDTDPGTGECRAIGATNGFNIPPGTYQYDYSGVTSNMGWWIDPGGPGAWYFDLAQVNESCENGVPMAPPNTPCPNPYAVVVSDLRCTPPWWYVLFPSSDCFYSTSTNCGCGAGDVYNVTIAVTGSNTVIDIN